MERLGYFAVVAVAIGSVVFGLDWTPTPMSPMPDVAFVVPVVPAPANNAGGAPPVVAEPEPYRNQPVFVPQPPLQARPPAAAVAPSSAPTGCNVVACTAAYRSFVAADCSYQPSNGPRQRCTKK